jgi:hypothetical protein
MSLMANVPTLSYITWKELLITYRNITYQIENSHTNKPYVYWDVNNPYILITSNKKLDSRNGLFYLIFNDSGKYMVIPNSDIEINFSENPSRNAITERIVGLSNETNDKFTTVQVDIDGIKANVSELDGNLSSLEMRTDEIDLEVKGIQKKYNSDSELTQIRDNFNTSILSILSKLGQFSSDIKTYMEDGRYTSEEKNKVLTYKALLEEEKIKIDSQLNIIIEYLEGLEKVDEEKINILNKTKDGLNTSINNLFVNIETVCGDNIFTNTEITTVITYIGKVNIEINECKNTVDECIFLGIDGLLIEELSNITLKQDEISFTVRKIENDYITESELNQATTGIEIKFLEGGGTNNLHNSSFKNNTENWKHLTWNNNGNSGGSSKMYIDSPPSEWTLSNRNSLCVKAYDLIKYTGNTLGVGFDSEQISVNKRSEWTLNCLLACHRTIGVKIEILEFDNKGNKLKEYNSLFITDVKTGGENRDNWTKVNYSFTLKNSNCEYFVCRFFMDDWTGDSDNACMWMAEPILILGHHDDVLYSANINELYEGITRIDMNGIKISNNKANTTTNITSDGFYINQDGYGDVFKVDDEGISLSQGIVTLNKNELIINSADKNINTIINSNGFYIQNGSNNVLKVDNDGIMLSQGSTIIDKNRIRVTHSNGHYTELNSNGLMHYQNGTGREYHYLMYGGEYICLSNEVITITLPDEFKGKNFKVMTSIKGIHSVNNEDITEARYPLLSFYTEVLNNDYAKGTFQVRAIVNAWNRNNLNDYGNVVGDEEDEKQLIKPIVAYWVFV